MTAKELIDELKKYDENTPVMFCSENDYVYDITVNLSSVSVGSIDYDSLMICKRTDHSVGSAN